MGELYFAYGSNVADIEVDGRYVRVVGVASLAGHRLAFTRRSVRTGTGVADVVPSAGDTVWGVVYELDAEELAALDQKEGAGWAYERQPRRVRMADGAEIDAFIYTVVNKELDEVPPSDAYLERLVLGARDRGFPASYIRTLEAFKNGDGSHSARIVR
jgi:gamma-glutamylcyclotransferase (GGCT)/AIG2-like uncharacterized protein YtfP